METVNGLIQRSVEGFGPRPALMIKPGFRTRVWRYRDIGHQVPRIARALQDAGATRGDRVAIWAVNRPEWGLGFLAAAHAGLVAVPLDVRSTDDFADQGRRADRAEARARIPPDGGARAPARPAGDPDRVTPRPCPRGRAAPGGRCLGRRPVARDVHVGHDRRPEGRDADPRQRRVERPDPGRRVPVRAERAPPVGAAAVAHVRADLRLPRAVGGRQDRRLPGQPAAGGPRQDVPRFQDHDDAHRSPGAAASHERDRAQGRLHWQALAVRPAARASPRDCPASCGGSCSVRSSPSSAGGSGTSPSAHRLSTPSSRRSGRTWVSPPSRDTARPR